MQNNETLQVDAENRLKDIYSKGVNVYMFIAKTKKRLKRVDNFPPEVIISVCKEYTRFTDLSKIRNDYLWFIRVLNAKSDEWHANHQIQEHQKHKKAPPIAQNVKDVLKGMFQ